MRTLGCVPAVEGVFLVTCPEEVQVWTLLTADSPEEPLLHSTCNQRSLNHLKQQFHLRLFLGTDTGIGHALAKYLDSMGFVVFAGVLDKDGPGAEDLRRTCSQRLSLLQLDITNPTQIKEAFLEVSEKVQNTGLWGVVNNAGVLGFPADGELLPMSTYRQCMDVNFFGAVEVSKTFLPLLRKSRGRLVNISSMAGGIPLRKCAAYGASKAALSMFSGVMRQELSKWGVKVAAVHPSGFKTGIQGTSDLWGKQEKELMEKLPAAVRRDYGDDYLLDLKSFLQRMSTHCESDLSPVLSDVLHALLATRPHGLYTPGKGAYLPLCVFSYCPVWLYDLFIKDAGRQPGAQTLPRSRRCGCPSTLRAAPRLLALAQQTPPPTPRGDGGCRAEPQVRPLPRGSAWDGRALPKQEAEVVPRREAAESGVGAHERSEAAALG
ncbi:17-beta-hydroxysteroid dehydrogenase type 2 [Eudromia elegans]